MYVIKLDGQEIYAPALLDDPEQQLLSISLQLEMDTAGSLSFIVPPTHAIHGNISKLKSLVTMEWDGVEIFRGRVLEERTDAFNQIEVYCEGELSFLLDSVVRPFTFEGTTKAFIEQAIAIHNEQVEEYKRFTLGDFSALTDEAVIPLESDGYADTLSTIRAVLEPYEGYLFARYENGVRYLDFVAAYEEDEGQTIEFGVNLVDLDNQTAAEELCTVLLPIGGMLEDGTTVTIASVNDGSDTIENEEAIAQYGRIVKTYAFDDVTDPAVLLEKAREKLNSMAMTETLILQAVDMHFLDGEKGIILPGRRVLIHTTPHGLDNQRKVCTALDLDPENPERATYTFGQPAKTQSGSAALIASQVEKHTRTVQQLYKHYTETDYTVKIHAGLLDSHDKYISQAFIDIDGINAKLLLKADSSTVTEQGERLSAAEVAIDGANAQIALKASQEDVTKLEDDLGSVTTRLSQAEIDIDGANAAIALKANQTTVDSLTTRMSNAEIAIDGANASIALKAEKATVDALGNRVTEAEATIKVNSDSIETKVSKDGIISAINQTAESVRISASKIELDGDTIVGLLEGLSVSANAITVTDGYVAYLESESINTGKIIANEMYIVDETVATQEWVTNKGYATTSQLSAQAGEIYSWVLARGYLTSSDLSSYATQSWVEDKGYLTSSDLSGYATESWVNSQGYMTSGDFTTSTVKVVTSVSFSSTGAIAVRDADGNIAGTAITGGKVTYGTKEITYVTYA